jgi:imidazolonepropionase-like amidohydrolase
MVSRAFGLILTALCVGACAVTPDPTPSRSATALVGGRVQTSPEAAPIADGVVLVEGGRILAVGPRSEVPLPSGAVVISAPTWAT